MSLKYVSAYLMSVLGGKEAPTAADVKSILSSVGAEADNDLISKLISAMEGKTLHEAIAGGMSKLQSIPSGGGAAAATGGAAAGAAAAAPAAEAAAESEPEEEEEDDMGFSLFD